MPNSVGQPLDRVEARLKVTGRAVYAAEHQIDRIAHGVLVTSAIAKGSIGSLEEKSALQTPGVLAVLSHKTQLKLAKSPSDISASSPADRKLQLLQDDRILYANQPIAVVVAETLEAAREAAGLIDIQYVSETPSVRIDTGLATAYNPERVSGAGDPARSFRGDIGAGLAQAETLVEQVYTTPFQVHNPMEPHATVAVWDGPEKLTLYDATQGIFGCRKRVAELLGIQLENVRVISPYLGGGFGSKGPAWSHIVLCAMAARFVNRPVKLVLARRQMFGPVGCRSETQQSISAGAKRDGTLTALKNDVLSHTSSFDEFTEPASMPTRMLYSVANNATDQRLVRSDIGTPSYMRAPGEAPGTFTLEVALDELAYALKMDPVALRLKNYAEEDEDKALPWSGKSLRDCYRIGAERFGWSRRSLQPRTMRDGNTLIGMGMATSVYPAKRSEAAAKARLNPDGTLSVEAGSQDLGTGTYTVMTQVAADALGIDPSKVFFRLGDTVYPETPVSGGSQTVASTGSAVYEAATALRNAIVRAAIQDTESVVFGTPEENVRIENGRIFRKDRPTVGETLELRASRSGQPFETTSKSSPGDEQKRFSPYSFGAQFAEVHVDADLGQIKVAKMVGAFGAGKILNSKTARSQFIGGMVWGIGFALYEQAVYDERLGRIVNNNLAEYHVPTNADVGSIDVFWIDESDINVDPMGAKGIGEIGITGAAAAIANAVWHATGKRVRQLPITLDKLFI